MPDACIDIGGYVFLPYQSEVDFEIKIFLNSTSYSHGYIIFAHYIAICVENHKWTVKSV